MTPVLCGTCNTTVEAYPHPALDYLGIPVPTMGLPAVILLDIEPDEEHGDVLVLPTGLVEFQKDAARLRDEGVPLRRNHSEWCKPGKPPPKKSYRRADGTWRKK